VRIYPGNYEDYLWRIGGQPLPGIDAMGGGGAAVAPVVDAAKSATAKRINPIKVQKMRERLSELEAEVAAVESETARLEAELAVFRSMEETQRVTRAIESARSRQERVVAEWEDLSAQVEEMER
jgi:ATP-binding cassette subfamily F protein 3